jgi:hypothetical protein
MRSEKARTATSANTLSIVLIILLFYTFLLAIHAFAGALNASVTAHQIKSG